MPSTDPLLCYPFLSRLDDFHETSPGQWSARCPAHEDRTASLSVTVSDRDNRGKCLLHCHAGCEKVDIYRALGITPGQLYPDHQDGPAGRQGRRGRSGGNNGSGGRSRRRIIATYDYRDESGNLLYQAVRYDPKDFRQRQPDGSGGWNWRMAGVRRVPFRLPEMLAAIEAGTAGTADNPILIIEGEKDVLRITTGSFIATCNVGGAGKWLSEYNQHFADVHVAIIPDNDPQATNPRTGEPRFHPDGRPVRPGIDHAQEVAWALKDIAASVRVVHLPGFDYTTGSKSEKDISDWIAAAPENTPSALRAAIADTPIWSPPADQPASAPPEVESDTDPGRLAGVFLQKFPTFRYWREEGYRADSTLFNDSPTRYTKLSRTESRATIHRVLAAHFREEALLAQQNGRNNATATQVLPSTVSATFEAIVARTIVPDDVEMGSLLARDNDGHIIGGERQRWISTQSGILHIDEWLDDDNDKASTCHPWTPDWFTTISLPYPFDPSATCPRWDRFLNRSLEGDPERIALLQEWSGYLLTPSTDQQKFLIIEGEGGNGKSVYLAAIEAMLGTDNCSHVPLEIFGQRFALTDTLNKLANIAADCGEIDHVSEGYLKSFTAGDRMMFDRKGIPPISATPTARLMLSTNNRPRIGDKSGGLWRRMLLVPFRVTIPEEEQVKGMHEVTWWQLSGELPGILNWALEGLQRLRQNGRFTIPGVVQEAISEYQLESNPARQFLIENYTADADGREETTEIYGTYKRWCEASGYKPLGERTFGKEIRRVFRFAERRKMGTRENRVWGYAGISRCYTLGENGDDNGHGDDDNGDENIGDAFNTEGVPF